MSDESGNNVSLGQIYVQCNRVNNRVSEVTKGRGMLSDVPEYTMSSKSNNKSKGDEKSGRVRLRLPEEL